MKQRIPIYYLLILTVIFSAALIYYINKDTQESEEIQEMASSQGGGRNAPTRDAYQVERAPGYKYIKPLLSLEAKNKSDKYDELNKRIVDYINLQKSTGTINDAAFFLRESLTSDWTGYNETEKYNPGSLMKVPELISILRYDEEKPGLLNQQVFYKTPYITEKHTRFNSVELKPGKSYTVKELLRYMIAYSDNNATILLDQQLDQKVFNKLMTDMRLPSPPQGSVNYPISAQDISTFFGAIFDAAYLSHYHSEFAAELLSTSTFDEGFKKAFPPGVKLIHKFGEAGNQLEHQLHEAGIVYINDKAYVLSVMTKGKELEKLPAVITNIASLAYQFLSKND